MSANGHLAGRPPVLLEGVSPVHRKANVSSNLRKVGVQGKARRQAGGSSAKSNAAGMFLDDNVVSDVRKAAEMGGLCWSLFVAQILKLPEVYFYLIHRLL